MKKLAIFLILFALQFSSSAGSANSGPVFWPGYPCSEIMAIAEDTPILVKNEELVFDFSESPNNDITLSGQVTAVYEMSNPTDQPQSVLMAFPFAGSLSRLATDTVVIAADGSPLPYDIYIGDAVNSYGAPGEEDKAAAFAFANIVDALTAEPYTAESFAADETGKLYAIDVKPAAGRQINFAIEFTFDQEKTKVCTNGFNRYEREAENLRIAAWCDEPRTLAIYVLGEDVDLNISAYADGELKRTTNELTYRVTAQAIAVKSYLTELIEKNTGRKSDGAVFSGQLYNLYAKSLDEAFRRNTGYSAEDDLFAPEHYQRVLAFVYEVDFPAGSDRTVSVSYQATGTMDRRETANPKYSFDYLLNPAANWGGFGSLSIRIITPPAAPHIINSSIELEKAGGNVYSAALTELPENDLSFTLYAAEKITPADKAAGIIRRNFGVLAPLVTGTGILLAAVVVLTVARLRRTRG